MIGRLEGSYWLRGKQALVRGCLGHIGCVGAQEESKRLHGVPIGRVEMGPIDCGIGIGRIAQTVASKFSR